MDNWDMDRWEKLFNKYKSSMHIGKKTIYELIDYLKEKGTITEMHESEIIPEILGSIIYNIKCSEKYKSAHPTKDEPDFIAHIKNPEPFIQSGEFNFLAYKFLRCDNNKEFYKKSEFSYDHIYNIIFVIFEMQTESIISNCEKLQLELLIYRGISEDDYKNRTISFYEYINRLEALDNGWY